MIEISYNFSLYTFYFHIVFFLLPDTLISRMATQNQLEAGSAWTHGVHQGSESHTRLEYEYRMMCSAHYYGKDCDTLCRPRDDQFGHYICDKEGNKMCLDGWQKDSNNEEGDYCNKGRQKIYIFIIISSFMIVLSLLISRGKKRKTRPCPMKM